MTDTVDSETVSVELDEELLAEIEDRYEDLGYASVEAVFEHAAVDAVRHPEFDRSDLRAMLTSEVEIQEERLFTSETVTGDIGVERPDIDANAWDWMLTETAVDDLNRRDDYAKERIVTELDALVSGEWRNPTEDLDDLAEAPHDKLLIGPFRLGCRVDHEKQLLYVLHIRMRGS
ncbi:hypothetical protein ACFQJ7_06435 [Halovenus rubra]|uniref:CopG family transcriptional regulator n=2 Tax=Halovenus rubra TaxID=869890 RepID=A0ABD5X3K7_9EURY|nr:hypothetical protein [Halovenus rubra]